MGGRGGCMLGGSDEDLCLPVRSRVPGFQPGDAEVGHVAPLLVLARAVPSPRGRGAVEVLVLQTPLVLDV
ncbi:hypothetical protein CRUP_018511, partial [Coryphaenoides rupestris]